MKRRAQLQAAIQQHGQVRLPPGVSSHKEQHSSGWVYSFRHTELGALGRIVLQGRPDGQTHVTSELAGEPEDPMTAKRAAIFKPLALELTSRMDAILGDGTGGSGWVDPPPRPSGPGITIPCEHVRCERCEAHVALLIFAEQATDQGGLEDAARMMYPKIAELKVPTWVVGAQTGNAPAPERPAPILKVWPEREPVRLLRPDEFNPLIERMVKTHCP